MDCKSHCLANLQQKTLDSAHLYFTVILVISPLSPHVPAEQVLLCLSLHMLCLARHAATCLSIYMLPTSYCIISKPHIYTTVDSLKCTEPVSPYCYTHSAMASSCNIGGIFAYANP